MTKLLFLLCCALLLLLASAAPALADFYYQVGPDGSVSWVDDATMTWGPAKSVPATARADVRVGSSWVAITRGGIINQSESMLIKLEVTRVSPRPALVIKTVDASTCQSYWGAPYLWNAWMTDHPEMMVAPYNGSQAGVWGRDWLVPMPPLARGTYKVSYSDKFPRTMADPLFAHPWEYQLVPPHDWTSWDDVTFVVK